MKYFLLVSSFLIVSVSLHAQQIVHIENLRLGAASDTLSGSIDLNANFTQNINDIFNFNTTNNLQFVRGKNSLLLINNINLTVFNGNNIVNDGYSHLRYKRKLNDKLTWESFAQAQYNTIIKVGFRSLTGTGLRWNIYEKDSLRLYFGSLAMTEYEEETTGIINRALRLSNYLSIGTPLGKNMFLDVITYFQPDVFYIKDFRTSTEASLIIKISEKLSFKGSQSLFYDARPPEGIRNWFYIFRNGLMFEF